MVIFNKKRYKGSLTVEASMVIPLFLFFNITFLSLLIMVKKQSEYYADMHQEGLSRFEASVNSSEDFIEISKSYIQTPVIIFFPVSFKVEDKIFMHGFTGYTGDFDGDYILSDDNECVYITETGIKYHKNVMCTYINIKPRLINSSELKVLRNSSGGKYYACKSCHPKRNGNIYVTSYGECYHSSPGCSGLKRTVKAVTLKEAIASGYTGCSKCA